MKKGRNFKDIFISKESYEWLKRFMEINNLNSISDAIDQLIMNYKAWNKKIGEKHE